MTGICTLQRISVSFNRLKPIGHFMYTGFNIKNFYVLLTQFFYVSYMVLRKKTAIISLYNPC
jgi:hypothetical protein